MTREEAIDLLDNLIGMVEDNQNSNYDEAFKMGIKALSREANDYEYEIAVLQNRLDIAEYDKERYKEKITTLEAENKGEWQHDGSRWKNRFICSACGYKLFDAPTNYCPNCGADMRGGE